MLSVFAPDGIPEIGAGDDLARIIGDVLAGVDLRDGDILAITSKIISKAEGRQVLASDREQAITDETVRVVATRVHPAGVTRIVENHLGVVAAAAGVDASNTPDGVVLLLPVDPDASATRLRAALEERFGLRLGVIVTDTLGRAWREGQTDAAIGASGVRVLDDLSGSLDASGKLLEVTAPAVGDEIAAAADLVKGKASGRPVAIVRGLDHLLAPDAPGARTLVRTGPTDMFRLGSDEAWQEGFEAGRAATAIPGLTKLATSAPDRDSESAHAAIDREALKQLASRPQNKGFRKTGKAVPDVHEPEHTREWLVVIPVKGTDDSKSRLGDAGADRSALALAIALDTAEVAAAAPSVIGVIVVTTETAAPAFDELDVLVVVEESPSGLDAAIVDGLATATSLAAPGRGVAVLLGDLPALTPVELDAALVSATALQLAMVPDAEGTGTTLITAADGAVHTPAFGPGSRAAHAAAGYVELDLPATSGLRTDVDTEADLAALAPRLGPRTAPLAGHL